MASTLQFTVGDAARLLETEEADTAFVLTPGAVTVYDASGNVAASGTASVDNNSPATSHDVFYLLNTGGLSPGDFTYRLRYTVGTESRSIRGRLTLLPATSKLDRWVARIMDWVLDSEVGEAQRVISEAQYRKAAQTAVEAYSRDRPYRKTVDVAMSDGVWEYALPSDWIPDFSVFEQLEWPVDPTIIVRFYRERSQWAIDELRGKWQFMSIQPSAGQTTRLYYTTYHVLTDAADTIPSQHFDAVAQYGAGLALSSLAAKASGTGGAQIAADLVNYRTKEQEYRAVAREMMRQGRSGWGGMRIYVA